MIHVVFPIRQWKTLAAFTLPAEALECFVAEIKDTVRKAEVADELEAAAGERAALQHSLEVIGGWRQQRGDVGDIGPKTGAGGPGVEHAINTHKNAGEKHNAKSVLNTKM